MTRVVTECKPTAIPFGVDNLCDPSIALATAVATGARFMREVVGSLAGWPDGLEYVLEGETIDPDDALVTRYDSAHALWRNLSDLTASTSRALARGPG